MTTSPFDQIGVLSLRDDMHKRIQQALHRCSLAFFQCWHANLHDGWIASLSLTTNTFDAIAQKFFFTGRQLFNGLGMQLFNIVITGCQSFKHPFNDRGQIQLGMLDAVSFGTRQDTERKNRALMRINAIGCLKHRLFGFNPKSSQFFKHKRQISRCKIHSQINALFKIMMQTKGTVNK